MGDLPYISSEQGGLIIHTELIYEYTVSYNISRALLYISKSFELKRQAGLYYTVGL